MGYNRIQKCCECGKTFKCSWFLQEYYMKICKKCDNKLVKEQLEQEVFD